MAKHKAIPKHRVATNSNRNAWFLYSGLFIGALIAGITPSLW